MRAVQERDLNTTTAQNIMTQLGAGWITFEDALSGILTCGQMLDVATLLGYHFRIDRGVLMGALCGGQLQNAMILLRAMDLKWAAAAAILELRSKRQRQPKTIGPASEQEYDAIDLAAAQRMFRFLRVRYHSNETAAHPAA